MTMRYGCGKAASLRSCREIVLLMRQQESTLVHLKGVKAVSLEEEGALSLQAEGLQTMLEGTRERYRRAVVEAVCALGGLTGRDYDVLCMYYVLGLSLGVISQRLQCTVRTVSRSKARALASLEDEISSSKKNA